MRSTFIAVGALIAAALPVAGQAGELDICADLKISADLPKDAPTQDQQGFNCFAWSQFFALNWAAAPDRRGEPDMAKTAADFGVLRPGEWTVWETYKDPNALFRPGDGPPAPWNAPDPLPAACDALAPAAELHAAGGPKLYMTAKVFEPHRLDAGVTEAGQGKDAYLIGQNGRLVHFDVRVNRDFFDYVVDGALYDPRRQWGAVQPDGAGIILPAGSPRTGVTGAMELKSSWLEIDDPKNWPTHRTIASLVVAPGKGCRVGYFALVGLHIAHKTETASNWAWATFEHRANAPDRFAMREGTAKGPFTFADASCVREDCPWNEKPDGPEGPKSQVVRMVPIADTPGFGDNVASLNARARALIEAAAPDSVWKHYELVNVQWPESPVPIEKRDGLPGMVTPLPHGGATPLVMSNATLETYAQDKGCLDCHRNAPISADATPEGAPGYASDYSFMFSRACVASDPDNARNCFVPAE